MLTEADFNAMAGEVAGLNELPLATAQRYMALVGDTPEDGGDGRVIVRDREGKELARIILPEAQGVD